MRANEFLIEAGLAKNDFYRPDRVQTLINKIASGSPFTKLDGSTVVLKPDRALLADLKKQVKADLDRQNPADIPQTFMDTDGQQVRLSQLKKTTEFGSSEKELLSIKPSDLTKLSGTGPASPENIEDPMVLKQIVSSKTFLASDLAARVISDPALKKAGKVGKAVIQLAKQLSSGQSAVLPAGLSDQEIKAIRDYAGEYLGIMSLVYGQAQFENKEAFIEHLGTSDLGQLNLYFPKLSSTPLADSIAIRNMATGDMMKISSKGGKIGAPPSLDSLKIPDDIRKAKPKSLTIRFMDTARASKAATQPFVLLNELYSMNPSVIDQEYDNLSELLPFTEEDIANFVNADKFNRRTMPEKVRVFLQSSSKDAKGTNFGKIHYFINNVVRDLVNEGNILPDLNATVLEILGANFIQIYSDIKKNQYLTTVKWPNKVNGTIKLYSKASASEPTKAKLSWYLS
jgi:hypothetical protein